MLEIKQRVLQCLIQSGRPKRKVNSRGQNFSAGYSLRCLWSTRKYQVSGVSAGTSEQGRPSTDMTENFLVGIT